MSGPFSKTVQILSLPTDWGYRAVMYKRTQTWYCQKKPYKLPLQYTADILQMNQDTEFPSNGVSDVPGYQATDYGMSLAYNAAYAKFVAKLGEQSTWGVNLLERKQSLDMIVGRAVQLSRFARHLNRFDFSAAAKDLGLTHRPKGLRKEAKAFANNFLEFHFGWEPLVKDIGGAVDLLQKPYPQGKVTARGQQRVEVISDTTSGGVHYYDRVNYDSNAMISAQVQVTNPNLYLANQLGFVNPLSVAWELVPFSFVVDWFVNVGQVLASFSDFAGVSLTGAFVTRFQKTSKYRFYHGPGYYRQSLATGVYVRRTVGSPPGPTLRLKPFQGFSVTRGVTAVSLLVQQLRHS